MKRVLTLIGLVSLTPAFAQKFEIKFQVNPELTFHQNQYSYRWKEKHTKSTINVGFSTAIQYHVTNRLFVDLGLGYAPRRLNTKVFFDQATLPPPHYSATKELNSTENLSYRTVDFETILGYYIIKKQKVSAFILAGIAENYLLNARYKVGNPQYDATYKKGYWQGLALNGGLGMDIRLSGKLSLTNSITYSFINNVQTDEFLFSQDQKVIPLPHKYLRVSTGIKMPL